MRAIFIPPARVLALFRGLSLSESPWPLSRPAAGGAQYPARHGVADRALKAELDHHLKGDESGNSRNGYGKKTVLTDAGALELSIPRDRRSRENCCHGACCERRRYQRERRGRRSEG